MEHSFDVEVAKKYGIPEAILLKHLYYWCEKNEANDKHCHDGEYWTYNSVAAFVKLFPYLSSYQISNGLKKLVSLGFVQTGNYNKVGYDRTLWYSVTAVGRSVLKCGVAESPVKPVEKKPKKEVVLPVAFLAVLEEVKKLEHPDGTPLFKNKIKQPYTKGLQSVYQMLNAIHSGKFTRLYELNPKWEENQRFFGALSDASLLAVRSCRGSWEKTYSLFKQACENYQSWFLPTMAPVNKGFLEKFRVLEQFSYSGFTKQSLFLCCVLGKSKPLKDSGVQTIKDSMSDEAYHCGMDLYKENFDELEFWKRVKELDVWYDEFHDSLIREQSNAKYLFDGGRDGWFKRYYDNLIEFTNGIYTIRQIGASGKNKTWQAWLDICCKKHNVDL